MNARTLNLRAWTGCVAAIVCVAGLSGCHHDLWDQDRYEPLEKGEFFGENESSSRLLVAGTIPWGMDRLGNAHFYLGRVDGELVSELPEEVLPLDRALLERGQERYGIYCSPCHGDSGIADGLITQRGFPSPTLYTSQHLLEAPIGYFFDVMTNGFGRMYSYAGRVSVKDRWAIAAYVRTLQLSQNATPDLLPANVLEQARRPQPGDETGAQEDASEH